MDEAYQALTKVHDVTAYHETEIVPISHWNTKMHDDVNDVEYVVLSLNDRSYLAGIM